jgi:hypothetical protein
MSTKSYMITNGTLAERGALACLIERGLRVTGADEDHLFCPNGSPVLVFSEPHCKLFATVLGFAILGLGDNPLDVLKMYNDSLANTPEMPDSTQGVHFSVVSAAADVLGLPYELLWEAQTLHHFGYMAKDVAVELRT